MDVALDQIQWHDRSGRRVGLSFSSAGVLLGARPLRRGWRDLVRWASGKTNFFITKVLNQVFNATAYTFPTTLYMGLWTAALTAASTGSSASEATYTGYARVAVVCNTTNFPVSAAGSAIQNATAITFPVSTATVNTVTYFAILDAATTGNMLYWGSITSTTVNVGDTPQVNINGLTASEA